MQPTIISKPEMLLVGMSFYGDPFDTSGVWTEENQIGRVWQRFMRYLEQHSGAIQNRTAVDVFLEVQIYNQETIEKGFFEVFVGVQVEQLQPIPLELLGKVLPATDYAVFTLVGEAIFSDWDMHIDQWLAQAGYRRAYPYSIQYYDSRYKGLDQISESTLDLYMPVEKTAV